MAARRAAFRSAKATVPSMPLGPIFERTFGRRPKDHRFSAEAFATLESCQASSLPKSRRAGLRRGAGAVLGASAIARDREVRAHGRRRMPRSASTGKRRGNRVVNTDVRFPMSGDQRLEQHAVFAALFEAHFDAVLAYARWRTAQLSDAEDVVADTFTVVWRRFGDLPQDQAHRLPWSA